MLFRLAYLTVTNAFAALRSLPMGDRGKDVEILALRHQITVLERQLGADARVSFALEDWAFLAALLTALTRELVKRRPVLQPAPSPLSPGSSRPAAYCPGPDHGSDANHLARKSNEHVDLGPPGASGLVVYINAQQAGTGLHVESLYWRVSTTQIRGILQHVRNILIELVAELLATTPGDQDIPSAEAADQAINVFLHGGERHKVNVTVAQSENGVATATFSGPADESCPPGGASAASSSGFPPWPQPYLLL
ncbi:AbiTii domain-containing protein [Nonomuraea sp. LPB2021202275-12-8]|uniref:AbiTii domain-containing protein n=1 Tax=Nonomuraea sp. LPB2021202275-12-8 TaxID=3120159 RepID=UPI00300D6AF2